MGYDSKADTLDHIEKVGKNIATVIIHLLGRSETHDRSKLQNPEKAYFDKWTPKLSGVTYGSNEYREMLQMMRPAIDHHQENNRHHPEFHQDGINSMNLIDIVEMICDWMAAAERQGDGDVRRSIRINQERFDMSPQLAAILQNTIDFIENPKGAHCAEVYSRPECPFNYCDDPDTCKPLERCHHKA